MVYIFIYQYFVDMMTYQGYWSIQCIGMVSITFQYIVLQIPGNNIESFFHKYQSYFSYTANIH